MEGDNETKQLLRRLVVLSEENNAMLRRMRRSILIGRVVRIAYWTILIGISIGALYFIRPYVDQLREVYDVFGESVLGR